MEEGLREISSSIKRIIPKDKDIRSYSPLTLAYLGDSVYELIIRTLVVRESNCSPNKLHSKTVGFVKAASQAKCITIIHDTLTEEEQRVYKRGYNSNPHSPSKSSTPEDYRKATGLESLFGYLYLIDEWDRIFEIANTCISIMKE